jgi:citrate lyase beta subunit
MLKSFFYIPANKNKYFKALQNYEPDYFIFDLEDSVTKETYSTALQNLLEIREIKPNYLIRPDVEKFHIDTEGTRMVLEKFSGFLLPKVDSVEQFRNVLKSVSFGSNVHETECFITVESPLGIINLNEILKSKICKIQGVGFGSHDYCKAMGISYKPENFQFARNIVLNMGKAFGCMCIDIASTNISEKESFIKECIEGMQMGFEAKPVLHPWQFDRLKEISEPYSEEEIDEAKMIKAFFNGVIPENTDAVNINGKIFEKPHISRVKKIIQTMNL